jgi:hypothetical protein
MSAEGDGPAGAEARDETDVEVQPHDWAEPWDRAAEEALDELLDELELEPPRRLVVGDTEDVLAEIAWACLLGRGRRGLSQREFAAHLGVSRTRLVRLEGGDGPQVVRELAQVLRRAGFTLAVLDCEVGRWQEPPHTWTYRDRAGRRFPAHHDVRRRIVGTWDYSRFGYGKIPPYMWERRYGLWFKGLRIPGAVAPSPEPDSGD